MCLAAAYKNTQDPENLMCRFVSTITFRDKKLILTDILGEEILVPEIPFDINELCRGILEGVNAGKLHNIIIKAEGVEIPTQELTEIIERKTGRETRPVVLSYLQRGGSPTMRDRILATECAAKAVKLLVEESESKAIGTLEGQIVGVDLEDALEMKSEFNMEMYELMKVLGK